jgi:HAD superfamily hydrolase (TIGR01484 family)
MTGSGPPAQRPLPLRLLPASFGARLSHLFTDIDDTLTADGMLPAGSYAALWDLSDAGISVVAVTGRPAGWCDHIARMWPVAGIVGENGAFFYSYDRRSRRMRRVWTPGAAPSDADELARVAHRVLREVPGAALAADQAFRVSDCAIDFREDVPALPPERIDAICRILAEEGVHYKVSSIHVNFWKSGYDKMAGVRSFLADGPGFEALAEHVLFIGDSPNDEPLFAAFPHSIAVANVRPFLPRLTSLPEYVTEAESAEGFREAAAALLTGRGWNAATSARRRQ